MCMRRGHPSFQTKLSLRKVQVMLSRVVVFANVVCVFPTVRNKGRKMVPYVGVQGLGLWFEVCVPCSSTVCKSSAR